MAINNMSVPAKTVAISEYTKKWLWRVFIAISMIIGIIIFSSLVRNCDNQTPEKSLIATQTNIPLASAPVTEWPKLTIPAGGRSERIQLPLGMHHITVIGNNYLLYSVYQDGHECWSFGQETCPDGAVTEYFVTNEVSEMNIVSYAFAPK